MTWVLGYVEAAQIGTYRRPPLWKKDRGACSYPASRSHKIRIYEGIVFFVRRADERLECFVLRQPDLAGQILEQM